MLTQTRRKTFRAVRYMLLHGDTWRPLQRGVYYLPSKGLTVAWAILGTTSYLDESAFNRFFNLGLIREVK